ncbi:DUF3221 domain-containing protein [Evansella sp. AB-rgal1]|uniref:DUF3221 domain-containing protein n=1 Tax=Evansella sp. AB-rgal1 TaxID=3242696 RepID=UPI00359D7295
MDEESLFSSSNDFGNAVWYTVADIERILEVGLYVRVEYREMEESYPGQSRAVSLRILKE